MVVSWYAGQAIGAVAAHVINIQISDYKKAYPLPKLSPHDVAGDDVGEGEAEPTQEVEISVDQGVNEGIVKDVDAGILETAQSSLET